MTLRQQNWRIKQISANQNIFPYLLLLTGFFLFLEIGFFIQSIQSYFSDFTFVSNQLSIPKAIFPGIIFFIAMQLGIHFLYCLLVWCFTIGITSLLPWYRKKQLEWGIGIWCLGLATILAANQYWFPNSKFSELTSIIFISPALAKMAFIVSFALFGGIGLASLGYFLWRIHLSSIRGLCSLASVFLLAVTGMHFYSPADLTGSTTATEKRPNIIIIGIDSLRPDFLNFFGNESTNTPFMNQFLAHSTVFSEAITPLARTFPSWTSILTGQYPRLVNVRSNLANQDKAHLANALPALLQQQGYRTIYATDETRFSNISSLFGFDEIITPPIGLNDFLIGTFNDFPFSNLLVNTSLGKWLFPYSYANRPVYFTYEPDSFLKLVEPVFHQHYQQSLFLAVHFCLPHAPYMWAGLVGDKMDPRIRYEKSINRVDSQVRDFLALLKENHFLDHAIVVLLSDHGEALELSGDRITDKHLYAGKKDHMPKFYPPSLDEEDWDQSAGHGTDVLGLTQYHALLAFQFFGVEGQRTGVVPGVVSLLGIKPTIMEVLGLPVDNKPFSLAPYLAGKQTVADRHQHFFLESDYSPEAIRTVYPEAKKLVLEGVQLFQIDPATTRLTVRPAMEQMIIQSKQYADIYDHWMLALYPQDKHSQMPILVNLVTGEWTNDLHSSLAKSSPVQKMMSALKQFYGTEINDLMP